MNKAIRLESDCALAYLNRGYMYHEMRGYERALEDYDNAVRLCPNYETDFIDRQFVFGGKEAVEKAIELLDSMVSNPPWSATDFYYTGIKALFENDGLSAKEAFQIALLLDYHDQDKITQHLANLKHRK